MLHTLTLSHTPVGTLKLISDEHYIIRLDFDKKDSREIVNYLTKYGRAEWSDAPTDVLRAAETQLHEYFSGTRKAFDLPYRLYGTEFQQRCWNTLARIPYGATWSYRQLAEAVGSPRAFRAVGQSNHRNPIAIILPCHRVIGADGGLCGFGGGLEIKQKLLELEQRGAE